MWPLRVGHLDSSRLRLTQTSTLACASPRLEPLVTLRRIGLSSRARTCLFVSSVQNEADAIARCDLSRPDDFKQPGYAVRGEFSMSTMSAALHHSYWLAKIDVEGHERELLSDEASAGYFRKHRIEHILAESWPEGGAPGARRALLARFGELGYTHVRTVDQHATPARMLASPFEATIPSERLLSTTAIIDMLGSRA